MKCALCHRRINKPSYEQAGHVFGPQCGRVLGLDTLDYRKQNMKAARDARMKGAFLKSGLVVQDGQVELFEDVAA